MTAITQKLNNSIDSGYKAKMLARHGEDYVSYRSRWDEAVKGTAPGFPLNIGFDLIDACNLRCPMCIRHKSFTEYHGITNTGARLSLEDVDLVLSQCGGVPSYNLGGSDEPTLHPDFTEVVSRIMAKKPLELRIVTNGLLLDEKKSQALIDLGVHMLSVSIDAFTPETYRKIRGADFEKLMKNIQRFLSLRKDRDFPALRVTFARQFTNAQETGDFIGYWGPRADLVDIQRFYNFRATKYSVNFDCRDPWVRLFVSSNKMVVPCCGIGVRGHGRYFALGTIDTPIRDIWNSEGLKGIRKMLLERNFPEPCLKCRGSWQEGV